MGNIKLGGCSLIKALKGVLERMDVENTIYTQIGYPLRDEREKIDSIAMREAVINAIVHNDYANAGSPKFEFFSDRLEITSAGGLPYGVSRDDFFNGYSSPRNKELMRIFRDLDIVEQLGSGIPRILSAYGRNAFEIRPNFLRVVKTDQLWNKFWSGGISNPLAAIEQITYLLFMKRLDELDQKRQADAEWTGDPYRSKFSGSWIPPEYRGKNDSE